MVETCTLVNCYRSYSLLQLHSGLHFHPGASKANPEIGATQWAGCWGSSSCYMLRSSCLWDLCNVMILLIFGGCRRATGHLDRPCHVTTSLTRQSQKQNALQATSPIMLSAEFKCPRFLPSLAGERQPMRLFALRSYSSHPVKLSCAVDTFRVELRRAGFSWRTAADMGKQICKPSYEAGPDIPPII